MCAPSTRTPYQHGRSQDETGRQSDDVESHACSYKLSCPSTQQADNLAIGSECMKALSTSKCSPHIYEYASLVDTIKSFCRKWYTSHYPVFRQAARLLEAVHVGIRVELEVAFAKLKKTAIKVHASRCSARCDLVHYRRSSKQAPE